jgi:outer membrane beta-barrel protein
MRRALAIALAACLAPAGRAAADCVDEAERARIAAERRNRRADEERDVPTAGRHELTLFGGYYVSDQFDGTFILGGEYAYHLIEQLAVQASFGWSRFRSSVAAKLEADRGVAVLPPDDRVFLVFGDLVWTPLHGKANLFAGTILHFDLYGSLGGGLVDSSTSLGAAGRAGLGLKVYVARGLAVRLDVRDHVYRQQVLATEQWVQDVTVTLGLSLFLPWSP